MSRREVEFLVDAQLPPASAKAITDAGYTALHMPCETRHAAP